MSHPYLYCKDRSLSLSDFLRRVCLKSISAGRREDPQHIVLRLSAVQCVITISCHGKAWYGVASSLLSSKTSARIGTCLTWLTRRRLLMRDEVRTILCPLKPTLDPLILSGTKRGCTVDCKKVAPAGHGTRGAAGSDKQRDVVRDMPKHTFMEMQ